MENEMKKILKDTFIIIPAVLLCAGMLSACGRKTVQEIMMTPEPAETSSPIVLTVSTPSPSTPEPVPTPVQPIIATPYPTAVPAPVPTPAPASAYVSNGPVPVITKNPTSEAINVGGKTWFIAHADNADSLTWQLIDTDGNVFSLDNAATMMPGLKLEALEGDTLAVSDVPAALNGWGVTARFENNAGYRTTEPAYIFVGDFVSLYGSAIEAYRSGKRLSDSTGCNPIEYGISELASEYRSVGYALKDIDKNGIPELIIAGIAPDYEDNGYPVFEIFTLENNSPVSLCQSFARGRYYLMKDNSIFFEGSGGASLAIMELFRENGSRLEFIEGYRTDEDYDNHNVILFHSTSYEAFYNDYAFVDSSSPAVTVVAVQNAFDVFSEYYNGFKVQTWIPFLNRI